jgi:hypothetical protein
VDQDELITRLGQAGFYPHRPQEVEHIQTHISHVFLAGELVYKLKKPLDLGFLDFSSLEKRRFYCHEEIRLNRRLAPDTYLRVEALIRDDDGSLRLAAAERDDRALDYCVVMKRLPRNRLLSALLAEGAADVATMEAIAARLVAFHERGEADLSLSPEHELEYIRKNLEENFHQTRPFVDELLSKRAYDTIQGFSLHRLQAQTDLFRKRVHSRRIKEGHGDLRSEHICLLPREIVIFDCIEFNERFRYLDVAAEVAFLAMDLDYLRHPDLARRFAAAYAERANDPDIFELLDFYKCYYAYTRGKIAGIRSREEEGEPRRGAQEEAVRYFELAFAYALRPKRPLLLIMSGLMGSGKSRLAADLAFYLDAALLQSDVVRKEMLGLDPSTSRREPFGKGIYDPEVTERMYDELMDRARSYLDEGRTVVLDASFSRSRYRLRASGLARRTGAGFAVLECSCPVEVLSQRLESRLEAQSSPSDGRPELLEEQARRFEPVEEFPAEEHIRIKTDQPYRYSLEHALERLQDIMARHGKKAFLSPKHNEGRP